MDKRSLTSAFGGQLAALFLCVGVANAQQVTVESEIWECSSPRSGKVLSSGSTRDEAVAVCGAMAAERGVGYDVDGSVQMTVTPAGSAPLPDPDPSPSTLPPFTFDIKGAGSIVKGPHDPACTEPRVVHVTSLSNDRDQPGTLMNAVRGDCRYIVFDVAGEIDMTGANPFPAGPGIDSGGPNTWRIVRSYLTIDGRTAPAPGITLTNVDRISIECRGPRPCVGAHDIIISNLRAVSKYEQGAQPVGTMAVFVIDGSEGDTTGNVVLDHLTIINSGQGGAQVYNRVRNVTIQHVFMYGAMLGHHLSGPGYTRENISVYKSVYAKMNERQPRLRYDNRAVDFVGNVIYGWGHYEGGASGLWQAAGAGDEMSSGNFEFNQYIVDPAATFSCQGNPVDKTDCARKDDGAGGTWFFANNIWPENERQGDSVSASARVSVPTPLPREYATAQDIADAGTHYKTAEESALLNEINAAALQN